MENVWAQLPSPCLHEGRTISYQLNRFRSFVARCFCKDEFLQVVELHRSGVPEVASSWRTDFAYIIGGHAEFSNDAPEAIGSFILNLLQEEHANNVAVLLTQWRGVESLTPSRRVELALMSCCPVLQDVLFVTKTITASSGITKPAPAALNSANHEIKDGVPDGPLQVAQQDSGNDGTTEAPKLGPHKKRPHTGPLTLPSINALRHVSLPALYRLSQRTKVSHSVLQVFVVLSIMLGEPSADWSQLRTQVAHPRYIARLLSIPPEAMPRPEIDLVREMVWKSDRLRPNHIRRQSKVAFDLLLWIRTKVKR